jgi:lycopene beta-cyclase
MIARADRRLSRRPQHRARRGRGSRATDARPADRLRPAGCRGARRAHSAPRARARSQARHSGPHRGRARVAASTIRAFARRQPASRARSRARGGAPRAAEISVERALTRPSAAYGGARLDASPIFCCSAAGLASGLIAQRPHRAAAGRVLPDDRARPLDRRQPYVVLPPRRSRPGPRRRSSSPRWDTAGRCIRGDLPPSLGRRGRSTSGYLCVPSERFHAALAPRLAATGSGSGRTIVDVTPTAVTPRGGRDDGSGRGDRCAGRRSPRPHVSLGFQKFMRPGGAARGAGARSTGPIIMDATVPQDGGFRFVYVLPFAPDRVLIESTSYANSPQLPEPRHSRGCPSLCERREAGRSTTVIREEKGVLPITLAGDVARVLARMRDGVPRAGLRAGLFHQATGYSLPEAARLASVIARDARPLGAGAFRDDPRARASERWRAQGFYRAINRMLFLAAEPERAGDGLQHFYRLPAPLIARFYAGQSTAFDKARILSGKPPVPIPQRRRRPRAAPPDRSPRMKMQPFPRPGRDGPRPS